MQLCLYSIHLPVLFCSVCAFISGWLIRERERERETKTALLVAYLYFYITVLRTHLRTASTVAAATAAATTIPFDISSIFTLLELFPSEP